jgi:hypothetical protein
MKFEVAEKKNEVLMLILVFAVAEALAGAVIKYFQKGFPTIDLI